jgi:hypothetical protein
MKIKTIIHDYPVKFDEQVNQAIEEGYLLERRELVPLDATSKAYHYAQLVLPDPPAEPEPFDPGLALHQVQTFCHSVDQNDCGTDRCPLNGWCQRLRDCADPTDWDLPEVDA